MSVFTATECRRDVLAVIEENPGIRWNRLLKTARWAEDDVREALEWLLHNGQILKVPVRSGARHFGYHAVERKG